ncbi:virulence factor Mce [Mycolicibacterium insubricum]|uniref:Virulence factor Mce n=1 Tax=Mycolicibacterium insubricum TaxID=444597 RepID=A0A1X0DFS8_9MYCO|nr:MlaD family protein [Mycolicibacterium insubricum]ORA71177.1 virulence factor Mce [Mycolicibacterium insubricum]BBZ68753.1 virulence factor Mce [Mycolicibacterium insubricum]
MLTRFIRIQLVIFAIGSLVGMAVMASVYMQVPTLLGWGRITVTVELPGTGGLYRFSNVTYRGVQVGKVTDVDLIPHGASATLSLKTSPKIPAKLAAHVRSASAIGEQYLDLVPEDDGPPYLVDGSRIAMADTTVPQEVGPLLDQTSALIKSIPKERLSALLNESYLALGGAGDDLALLVDSAATISGAMSDTREQTVDLLQDSVPLLNAQEESRESLRVWSQSLADITGTMVASDGQWRTILRDGPGAANEASRLFNQLKPTLPLLLANLRTVGQILVTYRAGLEQILVLMPPFVANLLSAGPDHNPTGMGQGDFTISEGDPPSCTVGFLPPSQWRSPEDTSEVDTPTGMYCKLPQDSPLAVRGARNYPCAGKPGKRAPTAAICNSDDEYQPLVMRQHLLGPYPLDPNLMAQGVPPDSRVTGDDRIYGPTEGTPAPAEAAPSAFDGGGPDVVATPYDPGSGRFVAPNGQTYQQANAGEAGSPKSWQELVMTAGA